MCLKEDCGWNSDIRVGVFVVKTCPQHIQSQTPSSQQPFLSLLFCSISQVKSESVVSDEVISEWQDALLVRLNVFTKPIPKVDFVMRKINNMTFIIFTMSKVKQI